MKSLWADWPINWGSEICHMWSVWEHSSHTVRRSVIKDLSRRSAAPHQKYHLLSVWDGTESYKDKYEMITESRWYWDKARNLRSQGGILLRVGKAVRVFGPMIYNWCRDIFSPELTKKIWILNQVVPMTEDLSC
jgi:hypothetical protein